MRLFGLMSVHGWGEKMGLKRKKKKTCLQTTGLRADEIRPSLRVTMALKVAGVAMVAAFYSLLLATGFWASRRSRKLGKGSSGRQQEASFLANRRVGLWMGAFTMMGLFHSTHKVPAICFISLRKQYVGLFFFFLSLAGTWVGSTFVMAGWSRVRRENGSTSSWQW